MTKKKVLVFAGTRPEMIKVAPVIRKFKENPSLQTLLVHTGQHDTLADQVLNDFDIQVDCRFSLNRTTNSLSELTSLLLEKTQALYDQQKPDLVLSQGDTTSVFCAGLACFYNRIPFGHIEAGLRTEDIASPFPEEFNRRAVSLFSQLNFCPTKRAQENLLRSGINKDSIFLTGNTVIDSLKYIAEKLKVKSPWIKKDAFNILFTCHRRENFGDKQGQILQAMAELCAQFPQLNVIFPVHPNPEVKKNVSRFFSSVPNMQLIDPLDYKGIVQLLKDCQLTITDSGGLQEEAPFLGVPVVVIREETERQEVIEAGLGVLAGTDKNRILAEVSRFVTEASYHRQFVKHMSPFGDGHASQKILDITLNFFSKA